MTQSVPGVLYAWMRPAWWLGRLRPGLRSATAADAVRMRELPPGLGGIVLPALAIALPILLSIGHATTIPWTAPPPTPSPALLVIYDVFTESLPFILAASVVGLIAPAAGVLLVVVYAISNFGVTVWSSELKPVVGATIGRLVTYLVLWLLIVELPLLGRTVFEWWSSRDDAPRPKRAAALVASALAVGVLTYIWAAGAPLLMVGVFLGAGREPPSLPTQVLQRHETLLAAGLALATLAIFAARYFGPLARVGGKDDRSATRPAALPTYLASLVFAMLVLSSVLREPVDGAILLAGLLLARPVARGVLRITRLAPALARIAWPIRLVAGFGCALMFAWYFLAIVGVSQVSLFFNMVITIAIGFIIIEVFLAADDVIAAPPSDRRSVATAMGIVALLLTAVPGTAFADNNNGHADIDDVAAAKAAAASAAGAAAFMKGLPKRKLPEYSGPQGQDQQPKPPKLRDFDPPKPPPPWWMPDGLSDILP